MGVIFSCQSTHECLARFEEGTVYLGHSTQRCGSYAGGEVYDADGNLVATYCNNVLYSKDKEELAFTVKNNCIYGGETPYAYFQGSIEGACVAAYLHYRNQNARDTEEHTVNNKSNGESSDEYWSFSDLWKNINERTSTLAKVLLVLALLVVGYNVYQLPAVIAYLLGEDIGPILLCVWGGAFLLGLRRNTYPLFNSIRNIFAWLWEYLIPYLHVAWIVIALACVYSIVNGFFSFAYLASVIYYLPATALPLTMPLYLINLARSLYLLYKYKR